MSDAKKKLRPVRVGVFESVSAAENAVKSLQAAGFSADELSVLCSQEQQQKQFPESLIDGEAGDATAAAVVGATLGGMLAAAGAAAGLATVAGIPVVVAGALAASMGGGVVGGLTGLMAERGCEPGVVDYFDQAVSAGKILISVEPAEHSPGRLKTAEELLSNAGAEPLSLLEG